MGPHLLAHAAHVGDAMHISAKALMPRVNTQYHFITARNTGIHTVDIQAIEKLSGPIAPNNVLVLKELYFLPDMIWCVERICF